MLDRSGVCEEPGLEVLVRERRQPTLVLQDTTLIDEVVERAERALFVANPDELDLAMLEPPRDQPPVELHEPWICEGSRLALRLPGTLMELDQLVVDRERLSLVARDLELDLSRFPPGAPQLPTCLTPEERQIARLPNALEVDEVRRHRPLDADVETANGGIDQAAECSRHVVPWSALADRATEPNPFYEPYALLAAWRHLAPPTLRVVLVWAPNVLPGRPPQLAGLFPIVRSERYKGLPLTVFSTWHHLYTYLTTPLLDAELATYVLEAFFVWLRTIDAVLFEWQTIRSGGAFGHALIDTLNRTGTTAFHDTSHTRAYFQPAVDLESYLERSISGKKRKELRRQERRLGETGRLVYDQLEEGGDLDPWLDEFLELEALGWKGQGGSALINDPAALAVFRAYAHGAFEQQRWMTLAMRLDGRAIAMKCNLLAGAGAVAFKITYDESYARYSPGVLSASSRCSVDGSRRCSTRPEPPRTSRSCVSRSTSAVSARCPSASCNAK